MLSFFKRSYILIGIIFCFTFNVSSLHGQLNQSFFKLNNSLSDVFYLKDWAKNTDTLCENNQSVLFEKIGTNKDRKSKLYFNVESAILKKIKKLPKKKQILSVLLNDSSKQVTWKVFSDSLLLIEIDGISTPEKLTIYYKNKLLRAYQLIPFPELTIKINIIPYQSPSWSIDSLKMHLTKYFSSFNTNVLFHVSRNLKSSLISKNEKLDNPLSSHDRYTKQMSKLRDEFYENHLHASKKEYYLFITPPFVDSLISSYSINKGMFNFTGSEYKVGIYQNILNELNRGISGSIIDNTDLLNDSLFKIDFKTWNLILKNHDKYLYYDNYEDVRTNSGFFAFYFWEEDQHGNIRLKNNSFLSSVVRPYKKNYPSYYLNITNPFFKIIVTIFDFHINSIHFIILIGSIYLLFYLDRKWLNKDLYSKFKIRILEASFFLAFIIFNVVLFYFINIGYKSFQVYNGSIIELQNQSIDNVIKKVAYNTNDFSVLEQKSYAEYFKKRGDKWIKIRAKNVAYFHGVLNEKKELINLRYISSSDSLKINALKPVKAETHYAVLVLKDSSGKKIETKIYNHIGVDLTNKIYLKDPIKRILLFANGYRPTSLGGDFAQTLTDLEKKGLEYPNTSNMIYPFDRFNYWNPWRAIDDRFKKRINATDVLYADGHFSVSTSNHGSLIDFSALASIYPKRCANPKKHCCYHTNSDNSLSSGLAKYFSSSKNTYDLLAKKPNRKGFKLRYNQGKIAGRNLLLQLNEIPNKSKNDTISIVAHSMGYAYALGIIDVIRNKINFGGFYIIAPENAGSGKVNPKEWKQVWQYGSKLTNFYPYPPCMQDGVAAQAKVKGLSQKKQVFIPKDLYQKQGFFESHFVGNYTWILAIPQGNLGYIKQN